MNRITINHLIREVLQLNKVAGTPITLWPYHSKANVGHFKINSANGGWYLVQLSGNGGERNVFNIGSKKPAELLSMIQAYTAGIEDERASKAAPKVLHKEVEMAHQAG